MLQIKSFHPTLVMLQSNRTSGTSGLRAKSMVDVREGVSGRASGRSSVACFEAFWAWRALKGSKVAEAGVRKSELLQLDAKSQPIRETPLCDVVTHFPSGWSHEWCPPDTDGKDLFSWNPVPIVSVLAGDAGTDAGQRLVIQGSGQKQFWKWALSAHSSWIVETHQTQNVLYYYLVN